jgi:predicted DNA-binding protein with PD1-like motif
LIHPGRFNPVRIQSVHAARARHFRLSLEPGISLFDGLVRPLADVGVENASTTILGGQFSQFIYCVAPPDASGQAVVAYTQPIDAGAAYMIFGNATIGKSMNGQPLVHCHAAIRTATGGIKGGHILTDRCIVGDEPISVLVTSLDGIDLRQAFDPETNIPLLQPYGRLTHE